MPFGRSKLVDKLIVIFVREMAGRDRETFNTRPRDQIFPFVIGKMLVVKAKSGFKDSPVGCE